MSRLLRCVALLLAVAACSSPPSTEDREVAALAPLKQTYSDVLTGFDIKPDDTLIVSLDANQYNGMSDDDQATLKRNVLAHWKTVWLANHSGRHAILQVRFIDFVGRTWATEKTKV